MSVADSKSHGVVLVVEDEWIIRENIVGELQDDGWRVVQASSAEEAIEILSRAERVDALVTDIRLTGTLTGWDIAEAFRANRAKAPVIYASANPVEIARQVPGSVFLKKPVSTEIIVKTCRRLTNAG